jgi:hypothetical protein
VVAGLAAAMPAWAQPLTYDFAGTIGTGAPAASISGTFTLDIGLPTFENAAAGFPATFLINGQPTAVGNTDYYVDTNDGVTDIIIDFGNGGDSLFFYFPVAADPSVVSALGPLEYTGANVYYDGVGGCDSFGAPCPASGFTVAAAETAVPEPASVGPFGAAIVMGVGYVAMRRRRWGVRAFTG